MTVWCHRVGHRLSAWRRSRRDKLGQGEGCLDLAWSLIFTECKPPCQWHPTICLSLGSATQSCVISGKSFKFSNLKLSHLYSGHNNIYLRHSCKYAYKWSLCGHSGNGVPCHPSLPSTYLSISILSVLPAFVCIITLPEEVPKCLPWLVLKTKWGKDRKRANNFVSNLVLN